MRSPFDLDHQSGDIDSRIVAALERISQAFRVLLWNEGKDYSLSPIQVQVLVFLLYHPDDKRKVSYLSAEFNMTKATISETVRSLEQKQLVTKKANTTDTRSYTIHLTKKGKEVARKASLFARELQAPVGNLPSDDKENLLLSLVGIIHHLNKAGIITVQRMCFSCRHYNTDDKGLQHFCALMNKPLAVSELQVDCPEYMIMEAE